jgi:hypothetical protein
MMKTRVLQAHTAKNGVNTVPTQGLKWRGTLDEDEHYVYAVAL